MSEKDQKREVPGTSPKKKRAPQTRDRVAARLKQQGDDLGSGKTYDRTRYVVDRIDALRSQGHEAEAEILANTLNYGGNIRGTYEIARLPEEPFFALCEVVLAHDAKSLLEARKNVYELIRRQKGEESRSVKLLRAKNGLYRMTSGHTKASILLSAQDLIDLSALLLSNMDEFQQKASEVEAASSGEEARPNDALPP